MTHQALPSGDTDADRIARSLARLRGPEIQPADGTLVAEDLRVEGQALADARAAILRAVAEAHPRLATPEGILADLEEEYGLPNSIALPTAERQARLAAKLLSRGDGSLPALVRTVRAVVPTATLLALASEDVAHADPAAVFALVILLATADFDHAALRAQIDALLADQLTGHAGWTVGRGNGLDIDAFRLDDPESLLDVDLLDH